MNSPQVLLQEYLQCELYHSIGAYGLARDRLGKLEEQIRQTHRSASGAAPERSALEQDKLLRVTRLSRKYNDQLAQHRHWAPRAGNDSPPGILRHPIPDELPLTLSERFRIDDDAPGVKDARRNPWANPLAWAWVVNFYDAAEETLRLQLACEREKPEDLQSLKKHNPRAAELVPQFSRSVVWPRDGTGEASKFNEPLTTPQRERMELRMELRMKRFNERASLALNKLPGVPRHTPQRSLDAAEFLHRIVTDNLSSGLDSVPFFVVGAATEAHLSMHAVEGWMSMSLGAHATRSGHKRPWRLGEWLTRELDRCIVLNTFVYCASRCAPWMFATDEVECEQVFRQIDEGWTYAVPSRCMWISAQLSLLALHRRAYSRALKGDRTDAYNDYYKLQRVIRNARRHVNSAPVHMTGAHEFLTALNARANQNIGELYRAEHAHKPALKHYGTALESLKVVGDRGVRAELLTDSRWYVELQLSQGKASYEMGKHKESLRWHLLAWRAFLLLLASETRTEASTKKIDEAIEWLERIRFEPELRKTEVRERLDPVVEQLKRIRVNEQLGALAAEILLRLGHVLFVLNLEPEPATEHNPQGIPLGLKVVESLSFTCLKAAAQCDPYNTLAGADLLKSYFRSVGRLCVAGEPVPEKFWEDLGLPEMARVEQQWPRGGDDYGAITRVAEYLMLLALDLDIEQEPNGKSAPKELDQCLAKRLLLDFFMHTDSINVRKAQTHHYLMQERKESGLPTKQGNAAIELVCMRRYSSATPLLPRPSAFRAHGGGYFVRLHPERPTPADEQEDGAPEESRAKELAAPPFGIVVDPGPDFIENLYRTGFSLSDIDMIMVTHDHVDHLNSLEPLLSLMYYRDDLLRHQETGKPREKKDGDGAEREECEKVASEKGPVLVYGNASVCHRYDKVAVLNPPEERRFRNLGDLEGEPSSPDGFPDNFQIIAMSSAAVDDIGHLDLSNEPSYGICFSYLDSAISLAITSDTPAPPKKGDAKYESWRNTWCPALKADALVAHTSTVPLSELRQLAELDARIVIRACDAEELGQKVRDLADKTQATRPELDDIRSELKRLLKKSPPDPAEHDLLRKERKATKKLQRKTTSLGDLLRTLSESLETLAEASTPAGMQSAICASEEAAREVCEQALELIDPLLHLAHRQVLRDRLLQLVDSAQALALDVQSLPRDAVTLEGIRSRLEEVGDLHGRIEFAMWLRSRGPGPPADLVGLVPSDPRDPTKHWMPPREHAYLQGTLSWARAYSEVRAKPPLGSHDGHGLFVLGELSEELGTVRGKIAGRINETIFEHSPGAERKEGFYALTSDVGLRIVVVTPDTSHEPRSNKHESSNAAPTTPAESIAKACVKILCTTCDLDTDRTSIERHHPPNDVFEVCVKGENEGVFYNCAYHNPGLQPTPLFLEQLERFDVFGR